MELVAREERFVRRTAMSDNLARGLDWTIRQRELEQAGELTYQHRRRKARAMAGRRAATVQVSLPAILGVVAALSVALLVLMNCIELTRLSTETVQLKSELQSLENENAKLNAEYKRMFDRETVQQAAEDAGMSIPPPVRFRMLTSPTGTRWLSIRRRKAAYLASGRLPRYTVLRP